MPDAARSAEEARRLGPWFHNLRLPDGTQTAPDHPFGDFPRFKWEEFAHLLPEDLAGWTALDIGCNAGFYSFELARRGARVTGIDLDPRYLAQAEWAAAQYGLQGQVRFRRMQVYDLAHEPTRYDLVLFLGVLYHLRYPMLGLDVVAQRTSRLLVLQTLTAPGTDVVPDPQRSRGIHDRADLSAPGWPKMSFLEHPFANDPTNWWAPNRACVEAMLRSSGMSVRRVSDETWLAEPDPASPRPMETWNRSEYLAAVGRDWEGAEGEKVRPRVGTLERIRER